MVTAGALAEVVPLWEQPAITRNPTLTRIMGVRIISSYRTFYKASYRGRLLLPAIVSMGFWGLNGPSSLNHANQQHRNRDNQEDMDVSVKGIGSDHSQK